MVDQQLWPGRQCPQPDPAQQGPELCSSARPHVYCPESCVLLLNPWCRQVSSGAREPEKGAVSPRGWSWSTPCQAHLFPALLLSNGQMAAQAPSSLRDRSYVKTAHSTGHQGQGASAGPPVLWNLPSLVPRFGHSLQSLSVSHLRNLTFSHQVNHPFEVDQAQI